MIDDAVFEKAVLSRGLVTKNQLEAARATQREEEGEGRRWTLGQLLVRSRMLTPKALVEILRESKPRCWQCPECLGTLSDADVGQGCRLCGLEVQKPRDDMDTISDAVTTQPMSWEKLVLPLERKRSQPAVQTIGRFDVLETLGQGGMGIVYKARDRESDRLVALKVLKTAATAHQLARFRREAESIGKLRHPDLVGLVDVGLEGKEPWIAMEYVPGETLQDRLIRGQYFSEQEALSLLARIARAVHHAHEKGVIHRDLKPANVILSPDGPKLTDFGLAKTLEEDAVELTRSGVAIGTPLYMSPEQAQGKSELVDARADVFALGVVLYLLLTGELPFNGDTHFAIYEKIVHEEPIKPRGVRPSLSAGAESAVLAALTKDREQRCPTALAFAEACETALGSDEKPARVDPHAQTVSVVEKRPRSHGALGVALVVLVALAAAAGWVVLQLHARGPAPVPPTRVLDVAAPLAVRNGSLLACTPGALVLDGRGVARLAAAPSFVACALGGFAVATPRDDAREEIAFLDSESGTTRASALLEGRVVALVPFETERSELAVFLDRGPARAFASQQGAPLRVDHEVFHELASEHVLAASVWPGGLMAVVTGDELGAKLHLLARGSGAKDVVVVAQGPVPPAVSMAALDRDRFALLGADGVLSVVALREMKLVALRKIAPEAGFAPARGLLVAAREGALAWAIERRAPSGQAAVELHRLAELDATPRVTIIEAAPVALAIGEEGVLVGLDDRTLVYH